MKILSILALSLLSITTAVAGPRHGILNTNISMTADGWTNIAARPGTGTCDKTHTGTYSGTCKVYVSNAGNDGTCTAIVATASPTAADICATVTVGLSMIRDFSEDQLLLNKGNTWNENLTSWNGGADRFCLNGKSPYRPLVIGAYGTGARPILQVPYTKNYGLAAVACGVGGSNVAVLSIDFYSYDRDPNNPAYPGSTPGFTACIVLNDGASQSFLIEDVRIRWFGGALTFQTSNPTLGTTPQNVTIRRSQILDTYHEQGLYTLLSSNLVLYQNLFDHNGWNNFVTPPAPAIAQNHNLYVGGVWPSGARPVANAPIYTENIYARDGQGNQARNGAVSNNNLHIQSAIASNLGAPTANFTNVYSNNVILEGTDLPSSPFSVFGWGIEPFANYEGDRYNLGSMLIQNNIIANTKSGAGNGFGIKLAMGVNNATVSGNIICNWDISYPMSYSGSPIAIKNLVGGSGYVDGSYFPPMTGGTGSGSLPYVEVSGGVVTYVNIYSNPHAAVGTNMGQNYTVNDTLTTSNVNLGGTGSGFSYQIAEIATNNTVTGNTSQAANCSGLGFPAPTPTPPLTLTGNYNATIGGLATTDDFLARARNQSRDTWDVRLTAGAHNNYVRQTGFGVAIYPYNVPPFR